MTEADLIDRLAQMGFTNIAYHEQSGCAGINLTAGSKRIRCAVRRNGPAAREQLVSWAADEAHRRAKWLVVA